MDVNGLTVNEVKFSFNCAHHWIRLDWNLLPADQEADEPTTWPTRHVSYDTEEPKLKWTSQTTLSHMQTPTKHRYTLLVTCQFNWRHNVALRLSPSCVFTYQYWVPVNYWSRGRTATSLPCADMLFRPSAITDYIHEVTKCAKNGLKWLTGGDPNVKYTLFLIRYFALSVFVNGCTDHTSQTIKLRLGLDMLGIPKFLSLLRTGISSQTMNFWKLRDRQKFQRSIYTNSGHKIKWGCHIRSGMSQQP